MKILLSWPENSLDVKIRPFKNRILRSSKKDYEVFDLNKSYAQETGKKFVKNATLNISSFEDYNLQNLANFLSATFKVDKLKIYVNGNKCANSCNEFFLGLISSGIENFSLFGSSCDVYGSLACIKTSFRNDEIITISTALDSFLHKKKVTIDFKYNPHLPSYEEVLQSNEGEKYFKSSESNANEKVVNLEKIGLDVFCLPSYEEVLQSNEGKKYFEPSESNIDEKLGSLENKGLDTSHLPSYEELCGETYWINREITFIKDDTSIISELSS